MKLLLLGESSEIDFKAKGKKSKDKIDRVNGCELLLPPEIAEYAVEDLYADTKVLLPHYSNPPETVDAGAGSPFTAEKLYTQEDVGKWALEQFGVACPWQNSPEAASLFWRRYVETRLAEGLPKRARILESYLETNQWHGLSGDWDVIVVDCKALWQDVCRTLAGLKKPCDDCEVSARKLLLGRNRILDRPFFRWMSELERLAAESGLQVIVLHDCAVQGVSEAAIQHLMLCNDRLYVGSRSIRDFEDKQIRERVSCKNSTEACRWVPRAVAGSRTSVRVKGATTGSYVSSVDLSREFLRFTLGDTRSDGDLGCYPDPNYEPDFFMAWATRIEGGDWRDAGMEMEMISKDGEVVGFVLPRRGHGRIVAWPLPAAERNVDPSLLGVEFYARRQDAVGCRPATLKKLWRNVVLEIGVDAAGTEIRSPLHLRFRNYKTGKVLEDLTSEHWGIDKFAKGNHCAEPKAFLRMLLSVQEDTKDSGKQILVIDRVPKTTKPDEKHRKQKQELQNAIAYLAGSYESKLPAVENKEGVPIRKQPQSRASDECFCYEIDFRIKMVREGAPPPVDDGE